MMGIFRLQTVMLYEVIAHIVQCGYEINKQFVQGPQISSKSTLPE
jgi:hypothetical protein